MKISEITQNIKSWLSILGGLTNCKDFISKTLKLHSLFDALTDGHQLTNTNQTWTDVFNDTMLAFRNAMNELSGLPDQNDRIIENLKNSLTNRLDAVKDLDAKLKLAKRL